MVAAELLFDLSRIDLNQIALPAQEIARLNPQAGPMRQLDHVIWMNEDITEIVGVKHVRDDEFWVPYHIPGRPMLPGVLMIEASAQLASIVHRLKCKNAGFLGFTRCDDVVFRGQVVPGDTLYILGQQLEMRPRRTICRGQGVVNGQLVFEATITGMVM